jgi:hypothetical protein
MNGYQPKIPRAVLGLTAIVMATLTMGALVVLPSQLDAREHEVVPDSSADACVAYHRDRYPDSSD